MFDTLQRFGEIDKWGNPWHGRFEPAGLRLPDGSLKPYTLAPPANAPDTYLVRFAGIPAPETPAEQAALGMQWHPDAVFYTLDKRYSPNAAKGIGYTSWLWRSPFGEVWRLRLAFAWPGSGVAVGAGTTTGLKVWASRFGASGAAVAEVLVLDTSMAWTNRGPVTTAFVFPHLAHSPTGDRTAITLRTGPDGWAAVPTAASSGARQAMVAAGRGSALYELTVTGLDVDGLPQLELELVVSSTAARVLDSGSSAATPRFQQDIFRRSGFSTTDGEYPPGVSGSTGWQNYGQSHSPSTYPTNTYSTQEQLVCGLYDPAGELRQVWYRRHETDTYDAAEPGDTDYAREDFAYTYVTGSAPTEYLTGQRDMDAFDLVSLHSRSQLVEHELLINGALLYRQTREIYSYRRVTISYEGHSSSDPPPWPTDFPDSEFEKLTEDYGELRVNGITVATGLPTSPSDTVLDPLRHAWTDFPPRILSSNVVAMCPSGVYPPGSPTNSWVQEIGAVDGSTYLAPEPLSCGATAQLAAGAWNPRTGELHLAVNSINGYV